MLELLKIIVAMIVSVLGYILTFAVGFYFAKKTHEKFDHWLMTVLVFVGVIVLGFMIYEGFLDLLNIEMD